MTDTAFRVANMLGGYPGFECIFVEATERTQRKPSVFRATYERVVFTVDENAVAPFAKEVEVSGRTALNALNWGLAEFAEEFASCHETNEDGITAWALFIRPGSDGLDWLTSEIPDAWLEHVCQNRGDAD